MIEWPICTEGGMSRFMEKLREKKPTEQSDQQFAHSLGISPALWSMIRRGQRKPGNKVKNAALTRYPELALYLVEDAQSNRKGVLE